MMIFIFMIDSLLQTLFTLLGGQPLLYHTILGFIIALGMMAAGKIFKWFLNTAGKMIIAKTDTDIDDKILEIILSRIIALSSIVGIYLGMKEIRLGLTTKNDNLLGFLNFADNALYLVTIIILTTIVIRIVRTLTSHTIQTIAEKNKQNDFNQTLSPLINRVITIVIIAFSAIVVLEHFNYSVTSLLTILGAGSLALGLAAQDTISNMISGFIIMIDRPFRVGDRIKIPSGEVGDIYEIGLRSTKILDFDNNMLIVPNNELIKTKIINYAYPANEIRVFVDVGVAYGSDIAQVKNILNATAKKHPQVLKDPVPESFLMNFGESALQFRLVCRVSSFQDQFVVAENLRVQVYEKFNELKIEIPLPQRVVHHTVEKNNALQTPSKRKKIQR
jgi:MscS family membrane protein